MVDFWADWCGPCLILTPFLEKAVEDHRGKIVLAKANLNNNRIAGEKYGIDRIPAVIIFKDGKPASGFIGLKPESEIRDWLKKNIQPEDGRDKTEEVTAEYAEYAEGNGFKLNSDKETVKMLIGGLLENERKYGKRYCPCQRVIGRVEEDKDKICPCEQGRAEVEKNGQCLCGLFTK